MAAISLKDLISAKQDLESKEKPESISIADLRKLMQEEVDNSKAQLEIQKDIKATAVKDKSIQLAQAAIAIKTDRDLNEDEAEALQSSKNLLENNKKILKELQKHSKILDTMSPEKAKKITEKSMGLEQFKTMRERGMEMKQGVKDFFTLKGFVNKTGLVDKNSTGIIATAINRRAAKQQYVQDRMRIDPNLKNLKQFGGDEKKLQASLGKQFEEQQKARSAIRINEKDIADLEKRGYSESQIARTGLLDSRESLSKAIKKVDPRVREAEKEATKTAAKETETKIEKQQRKAAVVKATKEDSQKNIIEKTAVKEDKQEIKKIEYAMDFSDEASIESDRQAEAQTDLLAKIEENTRPGQAASDAKPKDEKAGGSMLSGIVDFITNMLGEGLMNSIKTLLSPKNILKSLGKVFAIGMIVGALFEGLMDGFNEFMATGDIGKAIVAGLAGIVDFLTFGLFDKEKIKEVIGDMATWLNDHLIQPYIKWLTFLKDGFMNLLNAIKIPAITIPLPKVLGGDITLGPWSPFGDSKAAASKAPATSDDSAATTSVSTPAPTDANTVYGKSSENADKSADNKKSSTPVIVNAPSTVNQSSSQNIAMPAPIRNNDAGLSGYIRKNSAFV